jgi:hypothetical protein
MNAKKDRKEIGLAVVGSGTIGEIRAVFARDYPGDGWIGVCGILPHTIPNQPGGNGTLWPEDIEAAVRAENIHPLRSADWIALEADRVVRLGGAVSGDTVNGSG